MKQRDRDVASRWHTFCRFKLDLLQLIEQAGQDTILVEPFWDRDKLSVTFIN